MKMKVQIVGIQDQNYKLDNGYTFDGFKLHCLDVSTANDNLTGLLTTTMRIPRSSPLATNLVVGEEYNVYFDQKGNVDFIQRVKS